MKKTINIMGDTQRQQWHSAVNILRQMGGDMTREGRSAICDELDRYIDFMEDANEKQEQKTVYALICKVYRNGDLSVDVKLFSDIEYARDELHSQYEETMLLWHFETEQQDEYHNCEETDDRSRINDYIDFAEWRIKKMEVI